MTSGRPRFSDDLLLGGLRVVLHMPDLDSSPRNSQFPIPNSRFPIPDSRFPSLAAFLAAFLINLARNGQPRMCCTELHHRQRQHHDDVVIEQLWQLRGLGKAFSFSFQTVLFSAWRISVVSIYGHCPVQYAFQLRESTLRVSAVGLCPATFKRSRRLWSSIGACPPVR